MSTMNSQNRDNIYIFGIPYGCGLMKFINKFVWITVFLLLCVQVLAIKPGVVSLPTGGIEIEYLNLDYMKANTNLKLNFHVYNSTFYQLDNTTTSCLFHLYNNAGSHIYKNAKIDFDATERDYEVTMASGNFTRIGAYSYVIQCNNTKEAGFVSSGFYVNNIGENPANAPGLSFFLILILVTAFFLTGMFIFDNELLLAFTGLSGLSVVVDLFFLAKYFEYQTVALAWINNVWFMYYVSLALFFGLVLYLCIKLMLALKLEHNAPPTMPSPLQTRKNQERERRSKY